MLGYGSCRYYPTCSEYARWQIENNHIAIALLSSGLRIMRCNQLFKGGIDYPIVKKMIHHTVPYRAGMTIAYWLVPRKAHSYYLIKNFDKKADAC